MSFVNWMIDSLVSEDVIDLYFILSDLVDIDLTEAEICETAYFDSLATQTVADYECSQGNIPTGKLVL